MKIFYHGSPVKGLKVLKPKMDPRLGIKGVFVADEPYGPMMFSLLPNRSKSAINYETKKGKFIKGEVSTSKPLNEEGWLYTVKPSKDIIVERKPGRYHLSSAVRVEKSRRVTKEEVLKLGWKVKLIS